MILCLLKPTDYCNVGCSHCYLPQAARANRHLMSMETLARSVEVLNGMASAGGHDKIAVVVVGGEPLTIPTAWWDEAMAYLDANLFNHTLSLQSSLIPLRPEHLPFINRWFESSIYSSVDFSQRQVGGSVEGYQRLWMDKVGMARSAGIEVVPCIVPTTAEVGRAAEILDWLAERGFGAFNIDRYNTWGAEAVARGSDRPDNRQHARFLADLFDAMMSMVEARGVAPVCVAIRASLAGVVYGTSGDRWGSDCMSNYITIGADGGLNSCPNRHSVDPAFSNVAEGCDAWLGASERRRWIRVQRLDHIASHCTNCSYRSWCKGGCPIAPNGPQDGEEECSGYRSYLDHVRSFVATPRGGALAAAYLDQTKSFHRWVGS